MAWRVLLATIIVALVGACTGLHDRATVRLCRSLIPALNLPDVKLAIESVAASPSTDLVGPSVLVVYRADRAVAAPQAGSKGVPRQPDIDSRMRLVSCVFQRDAPPERPVLLALATERGVLSDVRLYLLKKHWIDGGLAALNDPDPISMVDFAPHVPRPFGLALQQILAALPIIGTYALMATAFALIYGLVGRIPLMFGEIAILSGVAGYMGFVMGGGFSAPLAGLTLLVVFGLGFAATVGFVLGRAVLWPLAHRPGQHILIASLGLGLVGLEALRVTEGSGVRWMSPMLARTIGLARMDGASVTTTPMALLVFVIATVIALAVVALMARSRFGRAWSASADDPLAAALMGVDPRQLLIRTMVLASLLAGCCGLLTAVYYGSAYQGTGLVAGLKALMAAIIGGIGSVPGAFAGGLLIGLAEALWAAVFPIEYRDAAVLVALTVLLTVKPSGLFAKQRTAPRDV